MKDNFQKSLKYVLNEEGGYVWDRRDPGGETNLGVTRNSWAGWLKRDIQDGEMAKLTVADVTPFYHDLYWGKLCDSLPLGLDYLVFDAAVNMGVGQSTRLLQKSLGCLPDGVIGTITMKAIQDSEIKNLINKFCDQKENFYKGLKIFPIYGKGWLARVGRSKINAIGMINGN